MDIYKWDTKLICGDIILLQNEWKVVFTCAECDWHTYNLECFLKHTLEHHLVVDSEDIKKLALQTNEVSVESDEYIMEDYDFLSMDDEEIVNEGNNDAEYDWKKASVKCEPNDIEVSGTILKDVVYSEEEEEAVAQNQTVTGLEELEKPYDKTDEYNSNFGKEDDLLEEDSVKTQKKKRRCKNVRRYFKCDICDKEIWTRNRYDHHMNSHKGIRSHCCEICGLTFADRSNLIIHHRRHLGIKPYCCEVCEKKFTTSTEKKIHERLHTGERPYACQYCEKTFLTSSALTLHRRSHTKERPHKCSECGKAFPDKQKLREHAVSHSNIRAFTCDVCDSTFKRRNALREHKRLHSDVKKYKCQLCPKTFFQYAGLYSHIKQHDRDKNKNK